MASRRTRLVDNWLKDQSVWGEGNADKRIQKFGLLQDTLSRLLSLLPTIMVAASVRQSGLGLLGMVSDRPHCVEEAVY